MARFNTVTKTGVTSPVKSTTPAVNAQGGKGFKRTNKSELFLLAVANFVGKDTFYEKAKDRDDRYAELCRIVAVDDTVWFEKFVGWLRNDAFMRSASIVAAVEGSRAVLMSNLRASGVNYPRRFIGAAIARADEPGELLAYWISKYGKNVPASVKKGIADAAVRVYNEYSLLKYDTESKGFRFADVIQLVHAKAKNVAQNDLFQYALNRRYGNTVIPETLTMIASRANLYSAPVNRRKELLGTALGRTQLKTAGITWEALAGWLQGPMDAKAWEAVIPNMGYMALLRNLRNFSDAGISQQMEDYVIAKIQDPDEVRKSMQFPFRFLSAYQANKASMKWSSAINRAMQVSLENVPSLPGKTLILVDRSGSMWDETDKSTSLVYADMAAIFGSALALRAEDATLVQYGSSYAEVDFRKGDSVLTLLSKFRSMGGTDTAAAIRATLKNHDRVILITDEQEAGMGNYSYYGFGRYATASENAGDVVPANIPLYTWNLMGYGVGGKSGNQKRHTFGGLTDKAFQQISLIEAGQQAKWPWELDSKK